MLLKAPSQETCRDPSPAIRLGSPWGLGHSFGDQVPKRQRRVDLSHVPARERERGAGLLKADA